MVNIQLVIEGYVLLREFNFILNQNYLPMLNFFRWILFLPVAFISATLAQLICNIAMNAFLPNWKLFEITIWLLSGGLFALTCHYVGLKIAPRRNNTVKWIVLGLLLILIIMQILTGIVRTDFVSTPYIETKLEYRYGLILSGIGSLIAIAKLRKIDADDL